MFGSLLKFRPLSGTISNSKFTNCFAKRFCTANNTNAVFEHEDRRIVESTHNYFLQNSDRYKMFEKTAQNFYQFDHETHAVVNCDALQPTNSISWQDLSLKESSNDDLIAGFENLTNYCIETNTSLNDEQFDQFIDEFTARLSLLSSNELIRALQAYAKYPLDKLSMTTRNFIELYMAFDQACTLRANDWLPDQLLFVSSIWIMVPLVKKTFFSVMAARLFNRYVKKMDTVQFSQAMFYLNILNKPVDDIRALENSIEKCIDAMTLEELSVVSWTFQRLNTKVEKPELREKILEYLTRQPLEHLEDKFLNNILSLVARICVASLKNASTIEMLLKKLRPTMDNRSLHTCILIAHTGVPMRICNAELTEYVINRCIASPQDLHELHMVDLENLSQIISFLDFETESGIEIILANRILDLLKSRLEHVAKKTRYGYFIRIMQNLTTKDVYDLDLLQNIFRPDFITFIYKANKLLDPELYWLDAYNRINLNGIYKGDLLNDVYLSKMGRFLTDYIPGKDGNVKKSHNFILSVEKTIGNMFKYYQFAHAIANRREADIFVCFDKTTLEIVDISQNYPPLYIGKPFTAKSLIGDQSNLEIVAFVSGNTKSFVHGDVSDNAEKPTGNLKQKCRQLEILGFHPIPISLPKWVVSRLESDREKIIKGKFVEKLRSIGIEANLK